ncbi:MAG: hypothetical protein U9R17_13480, partial [Thermodesulfobacteriota bacterium]|nr:hypothetical protein [Thermodesulfobacteriota bacterium]
LYNLGGILEEGGKLDEAEACYRRLLKIIPDYAQGKQNLGIILLLKGELREGFELYESRWEANNLKPRFSGTPWEGQSLKSKTILLYAEQGMGDTIQFVRYLPLVKALGCKVILAVQPNLTGVLSNIECVDQVISYDTNTPFYDYHATLLSLPHILKTTLDTIPNITPYLLADTNSINKWKSIFNNPLDFKVGLVWAGSPKNGNDKRRSFSVETLIPLLHIRGIKFFSLQMGEKSKELNLFGLNTEITDLSPELKDARDTAAAITLMDLIISVDTSVGHLSGALAHPTWLLLPFAPDWRWMLKREDTPWYPTMRLFRQPEPGDWGTVVEKIRRELTQIVNKGI